MTIPEDRLYIAGIAGLLTLFLWLLYRFTRTGLAVRAGSVNARAIAALGWSTDMLATYMGPGRRAAAAAGILIAPLTGSVDEMPLLVIPAMAAALIGGFTSYWLTFLGAIDRHHASPGHPVRRRHRRDRALPFLIIVDAARARGKGLPTRGFATDRLPRSARADGPTLLPAVASRPPSSPRSSRRTSRRRAPSRSPAGPPHALGRRPARLTNQLSFEQMAMAGLGACRRAPRSISPALPFELAFAARRARGGADRHAVRASRAPHARGQPRRRHARSRASRSPNMILTNAFFTTAPRASRGRAVVLRHRHRQVTIPSDTRSCVPVSSLRARCREHPPRQVRSALIAVRRTSAPPPRSASTSSGEDLCVRAEPTSRRWAGFCSGSAGPTCVRRVPAVPVHSGRVVRPDRRRRLRLRAGRSAMLAPARDRRLDS